jgi:hypothetical protein
MILCFGCGAIKPESPAKNGLAEVYAPCRACGFASSGDAELDLAFSDAKMTAGRLRHFGAVLAAIRAATDDEVAAFWTFIGHVSGRDPDVLSRTVPAAHRAKVEEVAGKVRWPDETAAPPPGRGKPWWQFWK